ncbi:ribose-phosphate diphosphokinase [Candidatus Woesearchaeota archaeon]|nr:ribose-phosphate diphosphokinase [Candidatus Woesearchaeota archaeon]
MKRSRRKEIEKLEDIVIIHGRCAKDFAHRTINFLEEQFIKRFKKDGENLTTEVLKDRTPASEESKPKVNQFIKAHDDGEIFCQLKTNVREKDVHYIQQFRVGDINNDCMEMFVTLDAILRAGARSITVYLPYFPYCRSDKKDDGRVPIAAKLMAKLIRSSAGDRFKRFVTTDLHAEQIQGFFEVPVDNVSAIPSMALYLKRRCTAGLIELITPDAGGAKRARYGSKLLNLNRYLTIDKRRTAHGKSEVVRMEGDVEERDCALIDDIIGSGGTSVGGARFLKKEKNANHVYLLATHGVFSPKVEEEDWEFYNQHGELPNRVYCEQKLWEAVEKGYIERVAITTSRPPKDKNYHYTISKWCDVILLEPMYAQAIICNQLGESISDLIDTYEAFIHDEKAPELEFLEVDKEDCEKIAELVYDNGKSKPIMKSDD